MYIDRGADAREFVLWLYFIYRGPSEIHDVRGTRTRKPLHWVRCLSLTVAHPLRL